MEFEEGDEKSTYFGEKWGDYACAGRYKGGRGAGRKSILSEEGREKRGDKGLETLYLTLARKPSPQPQPDDLVTIPN
jgi:hypothetical protein